MPKPFFAPKIIISFSAKTEEIRELSCMHFEIQANQLHVLELKESFPIDGLVTGADFSEQHQMLCVLTYNSVWLFEKNGDAFMGGKHYRKILEDAKQCEAVCFDGDSIIITNEQGELFSMTIEDIKAKAL